MMNRRTIYGGIILLALTLAIPGLAIAARDAGGTPDDIEVCMDGIGCFAAHTFSFEATHAPPAHMGAGRVSGNVTIDDIVLHKVPDGATIDLLRLCATRGDLPQVEIIIRRITADGTNDDFMRYLLTNVLVTKFSLTDSIGGMPLEEVRLNFTRMAVSTVGEGRDTEFVWDVGTAGNF